MIENYRIPNKADSSINKTIHNELLIRLREQKKELLQTRAVLSQYAKLIEEARQQRETANTLVAASPEILIDLPKEDQEQLIMTLIARVGVSGENEVSIALRLTPDAIRDLPILHEEAPHQPGSALLTCSPLGVMGRRTSRCRNVHYLSVPTDLEGIQLSVPVQSSVK